MHALHLECSLARVHEARKKITALYGSTSTQFPDGTKMRLVPTFTSVFSSNNKGKFASCIARQDAIIKGLATCTTWEMASNLVLDRKSPSGQSFHQLMMSIQHSETKLPLFHTIDKLFRSETGVVFSCRPEHNTEARDIVAGLVPMLRDEGYTWYLKLFSSDAVQRRTSSLWNSATRCIKSAEEVELEHFLAADDELNLTTNEPYINLQPPDTSYVENVAPTFIPINFPTFNNDDDSVSTFCSTQQPHQSTHSSGTSTTDPSPTIEINTPPNISRISQPTTNIPSITIHDHDTVSKLSDAESRITTLEQNILSMNDSFNDALKKMQEQNNSQFGRYENMLENMLNDLVERIKTTHLSPSPIRPSNPSEAANDPQTADAGSSPGTAGHC